MQKFFRTAINRSKGGFRALFCREDNLLDNVYLPRGIRFVDDRGGRSVVTSNFEQPAEGVNNVSVNIKEIVDKYPVLYARIGLKIHGVDERIYTEIVKIK